MTEPIRVLQVVASLNAGGMENYIMNLYRMVDKSKVQFDFVVHHAAVGLYEDEIQELGGKIYHFTVLDDKNVVKYISELNRFFDEHKEYQIIHGHLSSLAVFYLGVAKKYNVPWRIAHSHGAGFLHTLKGTAKYLLFRTAKWNANVRLACSTEAGKYQNVDTARVCMAESNDGIHNWVRSMDNPVISPEKKSWDADAVYKPTVVLNKQKNKLLMWYNGRKQNCERIGLAEYRIK